jgi:hypothetical protein
MDECERITRRSLPVGMFSVVGYASAACAPELQRRSADSAEVIEEPRACPWGSISASGGIRGANSFDKRTCPANWGQIFTGVSPVFHGRRFHHEGHEEKHEENGTYYLFPLNFSSFVFFVVEKH